MKILKLFDNFQTDDYYLKIDTFKYQDLLGDDWKREQRVSKEVIDKLKKLGYNVLPTERKFKSVFIPYGNKNNSARIYQLPDEYFILELQPRYPQICYLCDQFEGLIKCLNDFIK